MILSKLDEKKLFKEHLLNLHQAKEKQINKFGIKLCLKMMTNFFLIKSIKETIRKFKFLFTVIYKIVLLNSY